MALGGGFWLTQNKVLPGTYHNFISKARAFVNLSDRGYTVLPIALDWGVDDVRGNDITIVIQANVDEPTKWDVKSFLAGTLIDEQNAISSSADLKPNDFLDFKNDATLVATAGAPLKGGNNGATALIA